MRISAPAADERVPLDEVDLVDPDRYRSTCQHLAWQTLRADAPVARHEIPGRGAFWSFTRYADCERILKDATTFSSEQGTILASVGIGDSAGGLAITLMDPPRHGQIRGPAMRAIGHRVVRERAGRMREQVRQLIAPLLDGEQHDVARVLRRLSMVVAGELIGVPERYWDSIAFWTTACIAPEDPEYATGATPAATLRQAHHELFSCFTEIIRDRRVTPRDDLVSLLVTLECDGRRMDDWRVLLNCYNFILGANTTTPHVATHTLLALAERPQAWESVARDPALAGSLVEEGTRWASPTHHLVRRATREAEVGGTVVAEGEWVSAWVASANRDEAVFDRPYEFDPGRSPNPHLGFGAGPHYCIGAPASRLALGMLFEQLVAEVERFELAGEVLHLRSNWINGLVSMPMVAHRRRSTPC